jgi:hypothetical protein
LIGRKATIKRSEIAALRKEAISIMHEEWRRQDSMPKVSPNLYDPDLGFTKKRKLIANKFCLLGRSKIDKMAVDRILKLVRSRKY